jgi:hypothetical protein
MHDRSVFFQKRLPLGATVQIKMKNGAQFHGVVLEHEGGFLLLQETNGGEAFIDYDDISSVSKPYVENGGHSKGSGNTNEPLPSEPQEAASPSTNSQTDRGDTAHFS